MPAAGSAGFAARESLLLRSEFGRRGRQARLACFACLAVFIALGPAPGQIFGWHSRYLREWIMFSAGGLGVLKGHFTMHGADGSTVEMTPLEVLGLERYPSLFPETFGRLVFDDRDLRVFASRLCDHPGNNDRLSFHGAVATRQGWRPLEAENVCAIQAPAAMPDPVQPAEDRP